MNNALYIGLMSGTSLDAIDAVIVDFSSTPLSLIATHSEPISNSLKQAILALCEPGHNAIERLGTTDVQLGELFANACLALLKKAKLQPADIKAIGSHGQTIRHQPNRDVPYTLQIGDPNLIAARTGITTVADFRRRDIALGGQGAPLAPAFHAAFCQSQEQNHWVLNIGGIANLTWLPCNQSQAVIGFDTGPGNTLLDTWCDKHTGKAFDKNGELAASGQLHPALLAQCLQDPYFQQPAPKSTGREYFNLSWLQAQLDSIDSAPSPSDIQNTLTELTAISITNSMQAPSDTKHLWVCGGGAHNQYLMQRLQHHLPHITIQTTDTLGIAPDWIEATAFAWLAQQTLTKKSGNLSSVTGGKPAILGGIYLA